MLLADEEKMDEGLEDKSVVETVYSIRDKVVLLSQQNKEVLRMLEDEINARKKLESFVKTKFNSINGD